MKDQQFSKTDGAEADSRRGFFAWLFVPLALFPLVALLTYDWHSVPALNVPPVPSANWIGALGDSFAYWGYILFGLGVWVLPVVCVAAALGKARGRRVSSFARLGWFAAFLVSVSCLMQTIGGSYAVAAATRAVNIPDAGGAIGHLMMTRFLSPLLSDFGSAVLMVIVMVASLVGVVGLRAVLAPFVSLVRWAVPEGSLSRGGYGADSDGLDDAERESRLLAMRAREEAKRQKEEEKARIRAEKEAAKEARRAAKEAAKEAAREAAAAREASRAAPAESAPAAGRSPAAMPAAEQGAEKSAGKGPYVLPPVSLLSAQKKSTADHGNVEEMSNRLLNTLKIFGIDAELAYTVQGPVVTKYALRLAPGIRYSAVTNISDNLKGALHARSLRIEAPIPGEENIGVEVPNKSPAGITFREIIESPAWRDFKGELPLLFGKDAAGHELVADLASMPHMLIAGATGQGKSVCLNSIINGLLMTKTPDELKLIMVDPKSVEFSAYASLPHLIVPVITDNKKVIFSLHWAVAEMEKRLKLFARAGVRNIYDYNSRPHFTQTDLFGADAAADKELDKVPYIVIIIDEVADLMATSAKEVVPDISRLTAKARAAGIHLILATQRPDAKVITGTIKANIPGRVSFKTATSIDSRTILDDTGAENLIGRGDMLFKSKDGSLVRAQGAWISDPDINSVIKFIEEHSNPDFDPRFKKKLDSIKEEEVDLFADKEEDEAAQKAIAEEHRAQVKADAAADDFKKAVECVINTRRASISHFQRQMAWGYNHAAKVLDMLTARGIVSEQQGIGPRQIVMSQEELIAIFNEGQSAGGEEQPVDETVAEPEEVVG